MFSINKEEEIFWIETRNWKEISRYIRNDTRLIIAFGSCEQHGPHLPILTDTIIAQEISHRVAKKTNILATMPLNFGNSNYHLSFPGTVTTSPSLYAKIIYEILSAYISSGFKKLFLINSHGGNCAVLEVTISEMLDKMDDIKIKLYYIWDIPEVKSIKNKEFGKNLGSHAGPDETSVLLYLKPNLVGSLNLESQGEIPSYRLSAQQARIKYPLGIWGGNPKVSSSSIGKAIVESSVRYIFKDIKGELKK